MNTTLQNESNSGLRLGNIKDYPKRAIDIKREILSSKYCIVSGDVDEDKIKFYTSNLKSSGYLETTERRVSCHRCGNIRKRKVECPQPSCPHIYCGRCADKMKEDHGDSVFRHGCPVCLELCCCGNKTLSCTNVNHCYRKCPASKAKSCAGFETSKSCSYYLELSNTLEKSLQSNLNKKTSNNNDENEMMNKKQRLDYPELNVKIDNEQPSPPFFSNPIDNSEFTKDSKIAAQALCSLISSETSSTNTDTNTDEDLLSLSNHSPTTSLSSLSSLKDPTTSDRSQDLKRKFNKDDEVTQNTLNDMNNYMVSCIMRRRRILESMNVNSFERAIGSSSHFDSYKTMDLFRSHQEMLMNPRSNLLFQTYPWMHQLNSLGLPPLIVPEKLDQYPPRYGYPGPPLRYPIPEVLGAGYFIPRDVAYPSWLPSSYHRDINGLNSRNLHPSGRFDGSNKNDA